MDVEELTSKNEGITPPSRDDILIELSAILGILDSVWDVYSKESSTPLQNIIGIRKVTHAELNRVLKKTLTYVRSTT